LETAGVGDSELRTSRFSDVCLCDKENIRYCVSEVVVNFGDVTGMCYVVYSENLVDAVHHWSRGGPNRFYFTEAYDSEKEKLVEPSKLFKQLGDKGKVVNLKLYIVQF
jgi:hypothetical protein